LRDAAGTVVTPTASLFVRVRPGKVSRMRLQLMEKTQSDATTFEPATELLLGRRYAIDATFFDTDDNPCGLHKDAIKQSLGKQLASIDETMLEGKGRQPPHLIWAKDILLDYSPPPPRADGEGGDEEEEAGYPIKLKFIPNSKAKPVQTVRFHWGTMDDAEKDLRRLSAVAPTAELHGKFSRAKSKNISASVTVLLPDPDDPTNANK
jgi:hypothetical protein